MVAGHLQVKNDMIYMVLNIVTEEGKRVPKWIPTGLREKGNKTRAERMLLEERRKYTNPPRRKPTDGITAGMLFADFIKSWLTLMRPNWAVTSYSSNRTLVISVIAPYFEEKGIRLMDLRTEHIQEFYRHLQEVRKVTANTVIHYHACIHRALKYAVMLERIPTNPSDNTIRPKVVHKKIEYFKLNEIEKVLTLVRGDIVEFGVVMASYYGLRREEVMGLRWGAIDFDSNRIVIEHTVTVAKPEGKLITIADNRTKNASSYRSMPLTPEIRELLLQMRAQQEECRELCGNCYNPDAEDYIYVDPLGYLFNPNRISKRYIDLVDRSGLPHVTFHGLRHSSASLLLSRGIAMKDIQEWLGHSTYTLTANTYAHLDETSKIKAVSEVSQVLDLSKSRLGQQSLTLQMEA